MPSASATASASAATRIEVQLTDTLRIEPGAMTVPVGVPVTFVVTNAGGTDHEFYLGDEAVQVAHEKKMAEIGGMTHDDAGGTAAKPGETKELTYTFAGAGKTRAGCRA
jgi:uncharacterized cupredoxin-like copper-binding protein